MRPLLLMVLLAGLAPAAPVPKAVKKADDKTLLSGTWKVTGLTVNGRPIEASYRTFVFDAEGTVTLNQGQATPGGPAWKFTLDTAASPRRMQWAMNLGKNDWDLVYELDGDNLKVGFINKGAKPPAKVEPGEGLTLYVMSRDTPAK